MKWMIASDLHGSAYFCRKLMDRFDKEEADRVLLLGDLLYHGPRNDLPGGYEPREVIQMLNGIRDRILCVRGNCDTEVDQAVLDFPILADYALIQIGKKTVFATHGHLYNEHRLPPLAGIDILLCGHTHVPLCAERIGYVCMNPGSVSIPKESSWNGYMTAEDDRFIWKDLDGAARHTFPITQSGER